MGGGSTVLLVLASAAAGGVVTYFATKYLEARAAVSDPIMIAQAQSNLERISKATGLTPPTPTMTPYTSTTATMGVITPDFTTSLTTFQAWINANGSGFVSALRTSQSSPILSAIPALPIRSDGVLDAATFDWLSLASNT